MNFQVVKQHTANQHYKSQHRRLLHSFACIRTDYITILQTWTNN